MRKHAVVLVAFFLAVHWMASGADAAEDSGKKTREADAAARKLEKAEQKSAKVRAAPEEAKEALRKKAEALRRKLGEPGKETAAEKPRSRTASDRFAEQDAAIRQLQEEVARINRVLAEIKAALQRRTVAAQAKAPMPAEPVKKAPAPGLTSAPPPQPEVKVIGPRPVTEPAFDVVTLDLTKHFNNDGISFDRNRRDSTFDEYRQSYAAELLPDPGIVQPLKAMPHLKFVFPEKKDRAKNNVAADGQRIEVPPGKFGSLYVLGAAVDGAEKGVLTLVYDDGETQADLGLSDWCAAAAFGEARAFSMAHRHNWQFIDEEAQCSMWVQTIKLSPTKALTALVLPGNPKMHVFAMTLAKAE